MKFIVGYGVGVLEKICNCWGGELIKKPWRIFSPNSNLPSPFKKNDPEHT